MKRFLLLLAVAATVALAKSHERNNNTKSSGGNSALVGQFPWHMTLISDTGDICTGVFLENIEHYIFMLTAARCLHRQSTVYAGATTLFDDEEGRQSLVIATGRWVIHPDYNPETGEYDIGMVTIGQDITVTDRIKMIRLPYPGEAIESGVPGRISGWGSVDGGSVNNVLQWNDLSTISNEACASIYGSNVTESTLCAVASATQNPCIGDIGGPLIHIDNLGVPTLHGVASFVHRNGCNSGLPLGFVRVEFLVKWLRDLFWILN